MKNWLFSVILCLAFVGIYAQTKTNYTADDYIRMYNEAAVSNMVKHKVPASITLAQGLFESGFGNSPLATNANNHFGIKCHDWTGETYHHDDDAPQECFRKYPSVEDSYADHAKFLKTRSRYAKCFLLDVCDYKGWAKELKAAGYATLPTYPEKIIGLIERFKLYEYDKAALALIGTNPSEQSLPQVQPEAIATKETEPKKQPEKKEAKEIKAQEKQTVERVVIQESTAERVKPAIQREVLENNGIPYVISREGDTQVSLADEMDMAEWQIRRYNDFKVSEPITPGTRIYLAPKKDSNPEIDTHVVTEGENLNNIAQLHGIRKMALMEINGLYAESISVGQILKLH
jgi:LysM repeat protein